MNQQNQKGKANQAKYITRKPIILASKSPRRKELLEQAGVDFEILVSNIDEKAIPLSSPRNYVKDLSRIKAEHIAKTHPDHFIIGADTIVAVDDLILGKPQSLEESMEMLKRLSNRSHYVFTGFTISCPQTKVSITKAVETKVIFKELSPGEIQWYAATDEPYDKAGGYGIQGIGAFLVRKIEGSYSNVVGLPLCELMETLTALGIIKF